MVESSEGAAGARAHGSVRSTWLPLLLIVALGAVLRIAKLPDVSIAYDGLQSVTHAARGFPVNVLSAILHDPHPPLYYMLLGSWMHLGTSDATILSLSVLLSLLLVASVYWIARSAWGEQVALLAAEAAEAGLLPERARVGAPDDGGDSAYQPAAEIVADEGTEIRISVSPTVAGYLVLTDSDYPGWSAHVDGEERPILLANYFYRAVPVRPGDREVVFTYRSRPFELGRLVSAATLVTLLIGLGLVPVMRRRMPAGSRGGTPAE